MGNRGFRQVFLLLLAAIVLAGCKNSNGAKEEQPNFIVQDVQTVARSTPSENSGELDGEDGSYEELEKSDAEEEEVLQQYAVSTVQEDVTDAGGNAVKKKLTAEEAKKLKAQTVVEIQGMEETEIEACFYYEEISEEVFGRIEGKSYGEDCTVSLRELRYVRVLHYGFDGQAHIGELIVNEAIAEDVTDIFKELFDAKYPIEKMLLIDEYNGDDSASMADNNTSSFNFRFVEGTASLSRHAYGLAIDINPLYNPYLPYGGPEKVLPANAAEYIDRTTGCEYYILRGDICYQAFTSRGFTWGGDWEYSKDYQHFSIALDKETAE